MSDYLVWLGEEMAKYYGMDADFWMEWAMGGGYIPKELRLEAYAKGGF